MTVKDNLIAAKALIADPAKWIKGDYERDNCFCISGAIAKASGQPLTGGPEWNAMYRVLGDRYPSNFNDDAETTHDDVLAAFDRAIAAQDEVAT